MFQCESVVAFVSCIYFGLLKVFFLNENAHVYIVSVFVCFCVCLFECVCVRKRDWLRGRVCLVFPEWVRSDKAESHRLIFLRAASLSPSHHMADTQTYSTERNKIYVSL